MRRLLITRVGKHWFAQAIELRKSPGGDVKEIRRVDIPQSRAEIEEFARREGYCIEWDSPPPSDDHAAGT
jgi:hypothetical protein